MNIGDGKSTLAWHDPWIPSIRGFCPTPSSTIHNSVGLLRDLIGHGNLRWKTPLIMDLFLSQEAEAILFLPVAPMGNGASIV